MSDDRPNGDADPTDAVERGASSADVERALERLAPPGASVSALAVRAGDGAVLASLNPDRALAPASNTKLFTAALALDRLGPDYRFETAAAVRGGIEDRSLEGDLVLQGSGAPDLDPGDLATLADGIADHLDRVEGDLVLDCSRFEGPQRGPGRVWTDEHHAYGARSSALALSGNVVTVTVTATAGDLSVAVDPRTEATEVDVDVAVDPDLEEPDETPVDARPAREGGRIVVEGQISPDVEHSVDVPVDTPARHFGFAARDALEAAGVEVTGEVRAVDRELDTRQELASVESAPVGDLVREMNVDSDNFVAEQLARTVAAREAGKGSWDAWADLVDEHLASLRVETVRVRDGSGLSRYNRVPARGIVAVLSWSVDRPWGTVFFESLPGPGEGTLADRLDGVPVVAKTGTLTGARALSGRVGDGDDAVLFGALVGDVTVDADVVRDRQDEFVRALAAATPDGG